MASQTETIHARFELYKNYKDCVGVPQGTENISASTTLYSDGFTKCSALLLINRQDGAALLKHVGPIAWSEEGIPLDKNAERFLKHAQKYNSGVIVVPVFGDSSVHGPELPQNFRDMAEKAGVETIILDTINVPSNNYHWALSYDPRTGLITTQGMDKNARPIYSTHTVPGLNVAAFTGTGQNIEAEMALRQRIDKIKSDICGHIYCSEAEKLGDLLIRARAELGDENFYTVFEEPLTSVDRCSASELCKQIFRQLLSKNNNRTQSPEFLFTALEILADHDRQTPERRQHYFHAFLDCAQEARFARRGHFIESALNHCDAQAAHGGKEDNSFDKIIDDFKKIMIKLKQEEAKEKADRIGRVQSYLKNIAKGQATGHELRHFKERLDEDGLSLADIGATEDDVTRAFAQGSVLEKARRALSDYGFAKIDRQALTLRLDFLTQSNPGLDVRAEIELTPASIAMYERWHNEKRAAAAAPAAP